MADMFAEFWSICPRKVGKKAAEKEYWKARKDVEHDVLCNAMQRYADYHKAKGTAVDFICHPRTWLAQGRWEDAAPEPPPPPSNGASPQLPPCYRPREDNRPRESAEQKRQKKLKADAREIMRKRGYEPLFMPVDQYKTMLADIMADLSAGRTYKPADALDDLLSAQRRTAGGT